MMVMKCSISLTLVFTSMPLSSSLVLVLEGRGGEDHQAEPIKAGEISALPRTFWMSLAAIEGLKTIVV